MPHRLWRDHGEGQLLSRLRALTKPKSDGESRFTRLQNLLLLLAFAFVIAMRLPNAWVYGRFQDEEATVFLAYAWHFPWQEALFRPFAGYLNLGANASSVALVALVRGDLIRLEQAPYFTMLTALIVQVLPGLLLLTGRATWLPNRLSRVVGLLIIAIAPSTEEVYLNTMHIQFHLALCCAIILALDVPVSRRSRLAYLVPLFFGPLCGPGSIILLPLFALRALSDQDRGRGCQLLVLAAGASIQMLLFYYHSPVRGVWTDPITVSAAIFVRLILLPVLGQDFADMAGIFIGASKYRYYAVFLTVALLSAGIFGGLLWRSYRKREPTFWLLSASFLIFAVSLSFGMASSRYDAYAALIPSASERYNFLPIILFGLAVLGTLQWAGRRLRAWLFGFVFLFVVVGCLEFREPLAWIANGPSWPAEVAKWRADPAYQLRVWPEIRRADLSGVPKDCSKVIGGAGVPRYCEGGWLVGSRDF